MRIQIKAKTPGVTVSVRFKGEDGKWASKSFVVHDVPADALFNYMTSHLANTDMELK